jgi:hypothetical protein
MCCGKKYKPNNLDNRILLAEIREAYQKVKETPVESISDGDWIYLYEVYQRAYPNSKGQPNKEELLEILSKASQLQTAYK